MRASLGMSEEIKSENLDIPPSLPNRRHESTPQVTPLNWEPSTHTKLRQNTVLTEEELHAALVSRTAGWARVLPDAERTMGLPKIQPLGETRSFRQLWLITHRYLQVAELIWRRKMGEYLTAFISSCKNRNYLSSHPSQEFLVLAYTFNQTTMTKLWAELMASLVSPLTASSSQSIVIWVLELGMFLPL